MVCEDPRGASTAELFTEAIIPADGFIRCARIRSPRLAALKLIAMHTMVTCLPTSNMASKVCADPQPAAVRNVLTCT